MPTVSLYIRNDDWEAWRKLEKPSAFIHNALNPPQLTEAFLNKQIKEINKLVDKPGTGVYSSSEKLFEDKSKPIKTPLDIRIAKTVGQIIKQPQDIPPLDAKHPLAREDPEWEGPIFKKGKIR